MQDRRSRAKEGSRYGLAWKAVPFIFPLGTPGTASSRKIGPRFSPAASRLNPWASALDWASRYQKRSWKKYMGAHSRSRARLGLGPRSILWFPCSRERKPRVRVLEAVIGDD